MKHRLKYCFELKRLTPFTAKEVSRMVTLFIKKTESYARCKFGIQNADRMTMEKEGCEWLTFWSLI